MISQLLATIMMALGVASGTKATSNIFINEEKSQTVKRSVETYTKNILWELISEWHNEGYRKEYKKYYLENTHADGDTYTKMLDNIIIYNSLYTFEEPIGNTGYYEATTFAVLKIQNIYNGVNEFQLNELLTIDNPILEANGKTYISDDTTLDNALDLTMTQGTYSTFSNYFNNASKTLLNNTTITHGSSSAENLSMSTPSITLYEDEIKYVIIQIYSHIRDTSDINPTEIIPQSLRINATYQQPTYTYEIVDIPGLMFTVLSMPFSFISTAFNLTIFPNTPYQLNFANLFMVLLATFILMWLIKKVFH